MTSIRYLIKTNQEGGYDIIKYTTSNEIVVQTKSEEAAVEIIRILNSKSNNNGKT